MHYIYQGFMIAVGFLAFLMIFWIAYKIIEILWKAMYEIFPIYIALAIYSSWVLLADGGTIEVIDDIILFMTALPIIFLIGVVVFYAAIETCYWIHNVIECTKKGIRKLIHIKT